MQWLLSVDLTFSSQSPVAKRAGVSVAVVDFDSTASWLCEIELTQSESRFVGLDYPRTRLFARLPVGPSDSFTLCVRLYV